MDQFPGNSKKAKEAAKPEKKPIEKVVTAPVIERKKNFVTKFKDVFIGGDARNSLHYVGYEVLIPALRNMAVDAATRGIERIIYGEARQPRGYSSNGPRVTYNTPVNRFPGPRSNPFQPQTQSTRFTSAKSESVELIFASREEAETVLDMMSGIIESYDIVSVSDLKELTGLPSSHIDHKWGWSNLRGTSIKQVREGYLIDFPPVESF